VPPSYEQLGGVLEYTAKNLVAAVETNIKQHFVEYVESYVDAVWHKDATVALIEKLVPRKDHDAEKRAVLWTRSTSWRAGSSASRRRRHYALDSRAAACTTSRCSPASQGAVPL
jgi:hypothetical protein